jgi:predicted PurR-regulated permease PerM
MDISSSPNDLTDWSPRRTALATLVVAAAFGVVMLLYYFSNVFFLLLIAVVVAVAMSPLVRALERGGISRATASVAVYLIIGTALIVCACFALPAVYTQTAALLEQLPHSYRQLREYLVHVPSELVSRFAERLPVRIFDAAPAPAEAIDAVAQVVTYGGLLIQGGYRVAAVVLLAFYWSVYEDRTIRGLLLFLPAARRSGARELIRQIEAKLGAYVRAQGLICLIMGGLVFSAYWLIGLPYALALGVAAGVLEALPVFGPVLAAIPALLVALSVGPATVAEALACIVVLQQLESNLLVPRLMDRSVGVNAIVTLLSIAALSALWGLAGAILAIPMAAVAQLALDRYVFYRADAGELSETSGRDASGLLRYRLHELLSDVQTEFRRKRLRVSAGTDRLEEEVESLARDLDLALQTAASQQALAIATPPEVAP